MIVIATAIVLALEIIAYFIVSILYERFIERDYIQISDTEKELTDCFLEPEKFLQESIPLQFYDD